MRAGQQPDWPLNQRARAYRAGARARNRLWTARARIPLGIVAQRGDRAQPVTTPRPAGGSEYTPPSMGWPADYCG